MNKIVLDYSFLKSLLIKDDKKHELTENMIQLIDDTYTRYIPYHLFIKIMDLCGEYDNNVKEEVFTTLTHTSRIQHINNKELFDNYLNRFLSKEKLNFYDCLTIEYMKEKGIRNILSFNEKLDNIKGINRVYDFDKHNKNRLNFIKYAD